MCYVCVLEPHVCVCVLQGCGYMYVYVLHMCAHVCALQGCVYTCVHVCVLQGCVYMCVLHVCVTGLPVHTHVVCVY